MKVDLSDTVARMQRRVLKGEMCEVALHTKTFGSENGVYDLHCLTALEIRVCGRVFAQLWASCCLLLACGVSRTGVRSEGFRYSRVSSVRILFCISRVTVLRRLSFV